jgi:hypothetical protein
MAGVIGEESAEVIVRLSRTGKLKEAIPASVTT